MIKVFNTATKVSLSYKNIEEVCDHFRRLEHIKAMSEEEDISDTGRWDFIYWSHNRLSVLHEHFQDVGFSYIEQRAYETECDVIEVLEGDPDQHQ